MSTRHYKKPKKGFKKSLCKVSKSFWRRLKQKTNGYKRYRSLSEKEKQKKRHYARERYRNLSEDENVSWI